MVKKNESDCCQNSGASMEKRGKNKKKEKNEGEARVKERKEQEKDVGQQT